MPVQCFWVFGFKSWFEFKLVCLFRKGIGFRKKKKEESQPASQPSFCRGPAPRIPPAAPQLLPVSARRPRPAQPRSRAHNSPATFPGPARPACHRPRERRLLSLTGGGHPSSASSRPRRALRPSRGRARVGPRLSARAAPRRVGPGARATPSPYLRRRRSPRRPIPSTEPPPPNPSRPLQRARRAVARPSPVRLWGARQSNRVKVRSTPVVLARVSLRPSASSASLELRHRGSSPRAVAPRRRRPGRLPRCSPGARRRPGATPAAIGAPQRRVVFAPPHLPRRRPLPPSLAACLRPWPPNP
jgi:hypothetical protein